MKIAETQNIGVWVAGVLGIFCIFAG